MGIRLVMRDVYSIQLCRRADDNDLNNSTEQTSVGYVSTKCASLAKPIDNQTKTKVIRLHWVSWAF